MPNASPVRACVPVGAPVTMPRCLRIRHLLRGFALAGQVGDASGTAGLVPEAMRLVPDYGVTIGKLKSKVSSSEKSISTLP
jgi:hypothetical protein